MTTMAVALDKNLFLACYSSFKSDVELLLHQSLTSSYDIKGR